VTKPKSKWDFRETKRDFGDCLVTRGPVPTGHAGLRHPRLKGKGRLVLADAPRKNGNFEIVRRIGHGDALRTPTPYVRGRQRAR
jgi:hypothetical protein